MSKKTKSRPSSVGVTPAAIPSLAPDSADSQVEVLTSRGSLTALATKSYLYPIVPALLALLGSINTLWNGFAGDDYQQILSNQLIRELKNIPFTFTNSVWSFATSDITFSVDSYYRPLFNVLLSINYAIFGTTPWGWHLVNVLIHTCVTLLVFKVLFELTGQRWISVASACLFAVHPAHAESVAWLSGVTDPLMALLVLPGFYFYLRYRKTDRKRYLALTLIAYLLALLCKETAVAFPLILLYCDVFHFTEREGMKRRVQQALILGVELLLPTVVYFLMRYQVIGSVLFGSGPRYPLGPALLTIPLALAKYLKLMVVPVGYSYQHLTYFVDTFGSVRFLAPMALVVALAGCILLTRSKLLLFSAVWFIVWLAPGLAALRQFDPEYMVQERYLYVPSIGVCLAASLALRWLATRESFGAAREKVALAALGLIVAGLGSVYFAQNRVWNNTISLLRNCIAVEPFSGRAYSTISQSYFLAGNPREAEATARQAIALEPQFTGGYTNLSYFNKQYGKLDQAVDYLEQAISVVEVSPMTRNNLATVHLNLGLLYSDRKDAVRAEENMRRSVELWSRGVGWHNLGMFYLNQQRYEEAKDAFEQAAGQVPPRYAAIHASLGTVYERLGDTARARAEYSRYLALALPNATERGEVQKRLSALSGASPKK